jgi:transcriptional regulator
MYIPAHFAADGDLDKIAAFVERVGSADLVTFDGTRPIATLLPVIWDRPAAGNGSGYGRLLGHMALNNPQWSTAQPGAKALAIVDGPQAYVSPSWYQSTKDHGRTVPTWNYTSVHFTGEVTFRKDPEWLREFVTRLTEKYEDGRADRWWVTDAPEKFVDGQLRAIVGLELVIEQLEAKEKLSQNRTEQDRVNVIAALQQEPDPRAREIADLMTAREPIAER